MALISPSVLHFSTFCNFFTHTHTHTYAFSIVVVIFALFLYFLKTQIVWVLICLLFGIFISDYVFSRCYFDFRFLVQYAGPTKVEWLLFLLFSLLLSNTISFGNIGHIFVRC